MNDEHVGGGEVPVHDAHDRAVQVRHALAHVGKDRHHDVERKGGCTGCFAGAVEGRRANEGLEIAAGAVPRAHTEPRVRKDGKRGGGKEARRDLEDEVPALCAETAQSTQESVRARAPAARYSLGDDEPLGAREARAHEEHRVRAAHVHQDLHLSKQVFLRPAVHATFEHLLSPRECKSTEDKQAFEPRDPPEGQEARIGLARETAKGVA